MQEIPLQAVPKQSFTIVLDGVLYEIALRETAGCMSIDVTRSNTPIVTGARCVAGKLLLNYRDLEDGEGNFMFLTESGDLPWWEQFGTTQSLIYATQAELEAVRNGN